jgi:hypothetical protein
MFGPYKITVFVRFKKIRCRVFWGYGTQSEMVSNVQQLPGRMYLAEIPRDGTAEYFVPKKPLIPSDFRFKCPNCSHEVAYQRQDLSYRDQTMPSKSASKCA